MAVAYPLLCASQKLGSEVLMKKIWVGMAGVFFLLAVIAVAADQPTTRGAAITTNTGKTTRMNATGKVIEVSTKAIKIERTIKDNVEIMEFDLEYPSAHISLNDSVKIEYSIKEGRLSASRVNKIDGLKNPARNGEKTKGEKPASAAK